jgi:hypothetical protein
MNKKNLLAILAGFVVAFLLGWLIYGALLKDTMVAGMMEGFHKAEDQFVLWAMIAGILCWAILLTMLFGRMGINDFKRGVMAGFWIGLLVTLFIDLVSWSASNQFTNIETICIDVVASGIMTAITGGVIGRMLGMGKPATSTA